MQACDRCHTRKTRCDRRIPQCSACEKADVPCLHADKLRQRNVPRGYIDGLENMVKQLKDENRRLRQRLATPQLDGIESRVAAPISSPTMTETLENLNPIQVRRDTEAYLKSPDEWHSVCLYTPSSDVSNPDTPASCEEAVAGNVFAREVGYQSLMAAGEPRYLGSSSGIGFTRLLTRVVNIQDATGSLPTRGVIHNCTARLTDNLLADPTLPTLAIASPLIETYFQHAHIGFPLLHRPSFMTTVKRIYADPEYYNANAFEAFTFNMVLAMGGSRFNRRNIPVAAPSTYYAIAQNMFSSVMELNRYTALRAILLVSQHNLFYNIHTTTISTWHLIGIAARMCIELGLHVSQNQNPDVLTMEEEMRRRCFWCLYNLDRVVSCTLGRPVAMRDDEIDVPLPTHLDDDSFGVDQPIELNRIAHTLLMNKSSPFLRIIRIRRLSGQIINLSCNHSHLSTTSLEEKQHIRRTLADAIRTWRDEAAQFTAYRTKTNCCDQLSCFVTFDWYEAVFNSTMLLLYCPSPNLTMTDDPKDEGSNLEIIIRAARGCIESYRKLHLERRLDYSAADHHDVFKAGLAYICSIGKLLTKPTTRRLVPEIMSIVELTRTCSNVLAVICERWDVTCNSCELFNKTSNSIIRDALKMTDYDRGGVLREDSCASLASGGTLSPQFMPDFDPSTQKFLSPESPLDVGLSNFLQEIDDPAMMDEFRHIPDLLDVNKQKEELYPVGLVPGILEDSPFEDSSSPIRAET